MFLCLFVAYPCVTSLRFSYASLCYSITVPFFSFARRFSSSASHFHSLPLLCPAAPYKAGPRSALPQPFTSLPCPSISVLSCAVHISAIPFLFPRISTLCRSFSLPYCTQLFHCLSTDRRSAPFHCSARLCYSTALFFSASPFHCIAVLGCSKPFRCVAVPGSSIPCHCSTVQYLCIANPSHSFTKHFVAFPFLRYSPLFHRFACHFFSQRTAAYPLPNLAMPFHCLSLLCLFCSWRFYSSPLRIMAYPIHCPSLPLYAVAYDAFTSSQVNFPLPEFLHCPSPRHFP